MLNGMPPLQWLATFQAVIESGSFAGAAKTLGLTPSAISHQMRALEGMLGQRLFLRDKRQVTPTEEALSYATTIAESFARLMAATNRLATGAGARRLPIHCSPSFATLWLVPRLKDSCASIRASILRYLPVTNLHAWAGWHSDRYSICPSGAGDLRGNRSGRGNYRSPGQPRLIAEHHISTLSDIARVPLLHSLRCVVQWPQWSARFVPGVTLNPRGFQFDRAHLALASAADGLGIVLESTLQAGTFLSQRRLVMPFGEVGIPAVAHRLLYRREDEGHSEILAFVDWITRAFRSERLNPARG